jgi:hypothetical protein
MQRFVWQGSLQRQRVRRIRHTSSRTACLNRVDPEAWLADVIGRIWVA